MKKSFISLGLMLSAMFTLTNCAKELDAPVETPEQEGIPYEIIASVDPSTKTANEGVSTKWVANDALNVFYAEAGTTTYSAKCKFTVSDVATGRFTGNLDAAKPLAASNDWYAIYPDKKDLNTPASTGKKNEKFFTIGSKNIENQTQNGLNSTAHLAGYNMPLYAVAKNVSSKDLPAMTMKQLASVLKVVVKNSTKEELPVTDIRFTAPESIIGGFYIDITGDVPVYVDAPEYKPAADKYVSKTASLKVTNATIGVGESAEFYLAIKPFSVSEQNLLISVNGYEKTIEAVTATFTAGKIKTLNFNFDQKPLIYTTAFNYPSGSIYNKPDEVVGSDKGSTTSWGITYGNWNGGDRAQMRSYDADLVGEKGSLYMKFDVSHMTSVSYDAMVKKGGDLSLNLYYSTDSGANWTLIESNKTITDVSSSYSFKIPGDFEKVRVKFTTHIDAKCKSELTIDNVKIFGDGQIVAAHNIAVDKPSLTLDYAGTIQNVTVTSNAAWTAEFVADQSLSDLSIVTVTPLEGNTSNTFNDKTTVSVSAKENANLSKRTLGTINFKDVTSGDLKATVELKQDGRPENGVTVSESSFQFTSKANEVHTIDVTCNWNWEVSLSADATGFEVTPMSGTGNGTITVKSTGETGATGTITITDKDDNKSTATVAVAQAEKGMASNIVLTFPDENSLNNQCYSYTDLWKAPAKMSGHSWTIKGFNNNGWRDEWKFIKAGRKGKTSSASITSDQISNKISSVVVSVDNATKEVTTAKLEVASDAAFANILETVSVTCQSAGLATYNVKTPTANCYYRLSYDFASGSKNGFMQISKIEYVIAK